MLDGEGGGGGVGGVGVGVGGCYVGWGGGGPTKIWTSERGGRCLILDSIGQGGRGGPKIEEFDWTSYVYGPFGKF